MKQFLAGRREGWRREGGRELPGERFHEEGLLPEGGLLPEEGLLPEGLLPEGLLPEGLLPERLFPAEGLLPEGLISVEGLLPAERLLPEKGLLPERLFPAEGLLPVEGLLPEEGMLPEGPPQELPELHPAFGRGQRLGDQPEPELEPEERGSEWEGAEEHQDQAKCLTSPAAVGLKESARARPEARLEAMAWSSSAGSERTLVGTTAAFN